MTDTHPRDLIHGLAQSVEILLEMRSPDAKPMRITEKRLDEARAYLAQPGPNAPTEEEILDLSAEHFTYKGDSMGGWFIPISIGPAIELSSQVVAFAHAVLARWGK
jgi:hypothetical protein